MARDCREQARVHFLQVWIARAFDCWRDARRVVCATRRAAAKLRAFGCARAFREWAAVAVLLVAMRKSARRASEAHHPPSEVTTTPAGDGSALQTDTLAQQEEKIRTQAAKLAEQGSLIELLQKRLTALEDRGDK